MKLAKLEAATNIVQQIRDIRVGATPEQLRSLEPLIKDITAELHRVVKDTAKHSDQGSRIWTFLAGFGPWLLVALSFYGARQRGPRVHLRVVGFLALGAVVGLAGAWLIDPAQVGWAFRYVALPVLSLLLVGVTNLLFRSGTGPGK